MVLTVYIINFFLKELTNSSATTISLISVAISIVSAAFTGLAVWYDKLKPAQIIGMCNCFNATSDPQKMVLPCLWIQNIGAQPIFIEDIKICFEQVSNAQSKRFSIYPIPRDTSSDNEHLLLGEGKNKLGVIFEGFVLKRNEIWHNFFSFGMPLEKESDYDCLKGEWVLFVQIKKKDGNWITVVGTEEKYIFNESFFSKEKKLLKNFLPIKYSNREYFKWKC